MREAIARVKEGRSALPAELVSTATADELARAAGGGANYRGAALTREQLWALVEGPEIEANARRAAAEALARTSDGADRARLRVAAGHCAAPEVRVAIERIADEEPADGERERELRAARGSAPTAACLPRPGSPRMATIRVSFRCPRVLRTSPPTDPPRARRRGSDSA